MFTLIAHFRRSLLARTSERGATAVEYGLMVALIAVAIIAVVFTLGDNLSGLFTEVGDEIANRGAPAAPADGEG